MQLHVWTIAWVHSPEGDTKTGVGHFHEKLFKLKSLMNTDAGRRMAEDRELFMQSFLNQFLSELG